GKAGDNTIATTAFGAFNGTLNFTTAGANNIGNITATNTGTVAFADASKITGTIGADAANRIGTITGNNVAAAVDEVTGKVFATTITANKGTLTFDSLVDATNLNFADVGIVNVGKNG